MSTPKHQYIVVKVQGKTGVYEFQIIAFVANNESELLLERGFYANGVNFPQIEMNLLNFKEWNGPYHIHYSKKTGEAFVCFPGHTPDYEKAKAVLRLWTTGTVFTKENETPLAIAMQKCNGDFEKTVKFFETDFGITILSMDIHDKLPDR